jgi:hypothetical protein
VPHNFQIGVPVLNVTAATTFNIPLNSSVQANITLASSSAPGGFNQTLNVNLTGLGSSITRSGPSLAALPAGISSADCGPSTAGKSLAPGGALTCTITNTSTSGSSGPLSLEVFGTFGPGSAGIFPFQVCDLNSTGSNSGCGAGISRGGVQLSRIAGSGLPTLTISPTGIQFSPLLPKDGDTVQIRARIENRGASDASNVVVALVVNKQTVATQIVNVGTGASQVAAFEWAAAYSPRLSVAVSIDPDGLITEGDNLLRIAAVRNLSVEPPMSAMLRQGRSLMIVPNGGCSGFRFLNGAQSFCGGSSDFELSPTITRDGQLLVQVSSLNGGIVDLGSQSITGVLAAPDSGYQSRALLVSGHVYAVETNGKYALMYAGRIQSDVDPRLAKLVGGATARPSIASDSLPGIQGDQLANMLNNSKITVDVQWVYLENGSRTFQYGFTSGGSKAGSTVYRQPRTTPSPAQK